MLASRRLPQYLAGAAAAASLAAGGCGSGDGRVAVEPDVRGRLYIAVDADHHTFARGPHATLFFGDRGISTFGGCERSNYDFVLTNGELRVSSSTTLTARFLSQSICRNALRSQDDWLSGLLDDRPSARVRDGGETLVLMTGGDTVTFRAKTRPQGRAVVTRAQQVRYLRSVTSEKAKADADIRTIRRQVNSGRLTGNQGRARRQRIARDLEAAIDSTQTRLLPPR